MWTKSFRFYQALILLVAVSLFVGCSSTPKKPGAHARAVKGMMDGAGNGGDQTQIDRPDIAPGEQIPIDEVPGASSYNLCKMIHFDYDKSEIKAEYSECLDNIAKFLKDHPNITMIVEGHCDERGTNEYNLALGERRANSVSDFLQERGVASSRIITRSWGEEKPLELCSEERCYKVNRRAEFFGVQR